MNLIVLSQFRRSSDSLGLDLSGLNQDSAEAGTDGYRPPQPLDTIVRSIEITGLVAEQRLELVRSDRLHSGVRVDIGLLVHGLTVYMLRSHRCLPITLVVELSET